MRISDWSSDVCSSDHLENERMFMTIGSSRPLEDAARIAYRELVRWAAAEWGFDEIEAYMLLTQCGKVRLGNMVDPKYTIGASVSKRSEEHTSELQSLMRISYAVLCLKKKLTTK